MTNKERDRLALTFALRALEKRIGEHVHWKVISDMSRKYGPKLLQNQAGNEEDDQHWTGIGVRKSMDEFWAEYDYIIKLIEEIDNA